MPPVRSGAARTASSQPLISQLDATYQYIRNQIVRGEVEPGAKLSRRKLADEIGVSPALVQHALGQLEKAGLVECRPRSGTYVRELTADEFANLCDVRELVEPYAAARAAERITLTQLRLLETSCRRYQALESQISVTTAELELWRIHHALIEEEQVFHGAILAAAGNTILSGLVQSLQLLGHVRRSFVSNSLGNDPQVAGEHQQIVQALKARNPELAGAQMRQHLQNGRGVLEARLRRHSGSK
ncbi:MAG: GntR family transcriptional regulator [Planctomycetaceae bacterium]|nr:GntR family transcriptional regulator [Planctomycetaceae bacterium]